MPFVSNGQGNEIRQPARQRSVERKVLKSHATKERLAWVLRRGADAEQVAKAKAAPSAITIFVKPRESQKEMLREHAKRLAHIPFMRLSVKYQTFLYSFRSGIRSISD